MLMLYYVYKNYLTYIWIKFTVFLRENCAEQGANKAVFDALFVLSFAQDVSWNIFKWLKKSTILNQLSWVKINYLEFDLSQEPSMQILILIAHLKALAFFKLKG